MICWSAAEMPRQRVRLRVLVALAEKSIVVIYCGNHVGLYLKGTKYETLPITVGVLSSVRIPEVLQDVS